MPRCNDGTFLQPLDFLYLLFKNQRRNTTGSYVCFPAKRFKFDLLRSLLPDQTNSFTPDDFVDCLVCLFITCIVVAFGIVAVKFIWEIIDPQFASIAPSHKKLYVVANLSKSFFLGCMALSFRYWVWTYYGYIYDNLDGLNVKRCGMLYLATDVVALLIVPKLPFSTKMHHIVTTFLIVLVTAVDIKAKGFSGLTGVCKMALMYGIFSTLPFLVNAYLALRVVYSKASWLHILVKMSLWPYILCCACNWSVHLIWFCSLVYNLELSLINMLYLLGISTMVNDDIVLMKWLARRSSPGVGDESKQKGKDD